MISSIAFSLVAYGLSIFVFRSWKTKVGSSSGLWRTICLMLLFCPTFVSDFFFGSFDMFTIPSLFFLDLDTTKQLASEGRLFTAPLWMLVISSIISRAFLTTIVHNSLGILLFAPLAWLVGTVWHKRFEKSDSNECRSKIARTKSLPLIVIYLVLAVLSLALFLRNIWGKLDLGYAMLNKGYSLEILRMASYLDKGRAFSTSTLVAAIAANNTEAVVLLLEEGVDPNVRIDQLYPLHHACQSHRNWYRGEWTKTTADQKIVFKLIQYGAKVNAQLEFSGETPLHVAVRNGNEAICTELMRNGASARIKSNFGKTPIDMAKEDGNRSILSALQSESQNQITDRPHLQPTPRQKKEPRRTP